MYLYVFLCSLLPVIELRGSIPIGAAADLDPIAVFAVSVAGNFLLVPFILLLVRKILKWMHGYRSLGRIAEGIEALAMRKSEKVLKFASLGLMLFVAVPLPGTGAWTGALIAALLDMRMKYALPSIFAGVVIAGIIITGVSWGFLSFLDFLVL